MAPTAKSKPDIQHESTLRWPEGWPRTRFQDRKVMSAWKAGWKETMDRTVAEFTRLGATSLLITFNGVAVEDSGVAVYFSTKPVNDYAWQEALGFVGTVPTVKQIDAAYMERVRRIHPDGPTPDLKMFNYLTEQRDRARAWARGERTVEHEKVIAIDAFKEPRWNLNAIRLTIYAMRQIERCGSAVVMDRAFRGFSKQLTAQAIGASQGGVHEHEAVAVS